MLGLDPPRTRRRPCRRRRGRSGRSREAPRPGRGAALGTESAPGRPRRRGSAARRERQRARAEGPRRRARRSSVPSAAGYVEPPRVPQAADRGGARGGRPSSLLRRMRSGQATVPPTRGRLPARARRTDARPRTVAPAPRKRRSRRRRRRVRLPLRARSSGARRVVSRSPRARSEPADLPRRDLLRERALELAAASGGLLRVEPVQDERRVDAVALRVLQDTRPEVVVLRFPERRVVAQPGRLEHVTREYDGVVERRRREERPPAEGGSPSVEEVNAPEGRRRGPRRGLLAPTRRTPRAVSRSARQRASQSGNAASSASIRATWRPRASSSARFREPARPSWSSFRSTRTRGSSSAASVASVPSRDASSTTISSRSETDCRRTL